MATATLSLFDPAPAPRARPALRLVPTATAPAGGSTLDDVLVDAWEGLAARGVVVCPVCSGAMAPRYAAGAAPVGGRCSDCGSTLA